MSKDACSNGVILRLSISGHTFTILSLNGMNSKPEIQVGREHLYNNQVAFLMFQGVTDIGIPSYYT